MRGTDSYSESLFTTVKLDDFTIPEFDFAAFAEHDDFDLYGEGWQNRHPAVELAHELFPPLCFLLSGNL